VPFPAIDSTTNVGSVYGGVTGYWTREGAALTPSSANFGRVILDAKKLTAYAEVPNELIQDSIIAFQAFLSQIFPEALAFFEDIKFIAGTGVDEPLGVLNSPASVTVNKELNQPTKTITWNNIVQMYARILPSSLGRAVWLASIDTFPELATMSLPVGTGGSAVWIGNLQQPGAMAPPMTILGRPVVFTEKASVLGTVGDITLTDFSYYLIGDRQTMTAADSADYKFANDLTAFRFVERLDGQPWLLNSITPANGGPALSSIVQLQTR
jgi:HK97 family phage major capsid protein